MIALFSTMFYLICASFSLSTLFCYKCSTSLKSNNHRYAILYKAGCIPPLIEGHVSYEYSDSEENQEETQEGGFSDTSSDSQSSEFSSEMSDLDHNDENDTILYIESECDTSHDDSEGENTVGPRDFVIV